MSRKCWVNNFLTLRSVFSAPIIGYLTIRVSHPTRNLSQVLHSRAHTKKDFINTYSWLLFSTIFHVNFSLKKKLMWMCQIFMFFFILKNMTNFFPTLKKWRKMGWKKSILYFLTWTIVFKKQQHILTSSYLQL